MQSQHGAELLRRIPLSVRLHQVADCELEPSYRLSQQVDGGFKNAVAMAEAAICALDADRPSVVVASGPPFFTFLAARWVARRFAVPLVLDYRDEWSECPFDFVAKCRDNETWERKCLRDADAVVFTTQSHLEHQIRVFPELDVRKARLVPNGWESGDFERGEENWCKGTDVMSLAHVGALGGHSSPDDFVGTLRRLFESKPQWREALQLHFIGRRSRAATDTLSELAKTCPVTVVDLVGKKEAIARMRGANALLLLAGRGMERYLPGKLFDYIAAKRPVIVFGAEGEASRLVERLGIGRLCQVSDVPALSAALEWARGVSASSARIERVERWLDEHRRDVLAKRFFDVLSAVEEAR